MEEQLQKAIGLLRICYSYLEETGLLEDFNEYAGIQQAETQEEPTEE